VEYRVEAEAPIDTYVLSPEQYDNYLAGGTFDVFASYKSITGHQHAVRLPYKQGEWILVLANTQTRPTAVFYETR
jgi:hypothetical protein